MGMKPMMLELFAGHHSMSRAFANHGYETRTVDWDPVFQVDLHADIGTLTIRDVLDLCDGRYPDVIWASPDCTTFSVAAIGHHRRLDPATGLLLPKTGYAADCDRIDAHVIQLMRGLHPCYWFVENPMGGMRRARFLQGLPHVTTTYCQWGDTRRKPTDIWTNHPWLLRHGLPCCHNGDPCHEAAPRGSRTGTQGLNGHRDRSRIPGALCERIAGLCDPLPDGRPPLLLDSRRIAVVNTLF